MVRCVDPGEPDAEALECERGWRAGHPMSVGAFAAGEGEARERRPGGWSLAAIGLAVASLGAAAQPPAPNHSPQVRYPIAARVGALRGVENVGLVAAGLYRGSAPSGEGLDALKALGIKTVVNLRHYHGSQEERRCRERGLAYERIVLESSDVPSDADVQRFLTVASDPARRPLYFHCWRGKDRTGAMCAAYRMAIEGWPLDAALAEMEAYGFYRGWKDLLGFVEGFSARREALWPERP